MITEEEVMAAIHTVIDPDLELSVVELGLVYAVEIDNEDGTVNVVMTLTSPSCPVGPMLIAQTQDVVGDIEEVEQVTVDLVFDPPWDPKTMASDDVKDILGIW